MTLLDGGILQHFGRTAKVKKTIKKDQRNLTKITDSIPACVLKVDRFVTLLISQIQKMLPTRCSKK